MAYQAPSWLPHGKLATQYIARVQNFTGGAGDASYVRQKQNTLRTLVKDHENFADAVLRNPFHPFETSLEHATAMSILRHASSKTAAQEQISDHQRLGHADAALLSLKAMLDKASQQIPSYACSLLRDTSDCLIDCSIHLPKRCGRKYSCHKPGIIDMHRTRGMQRRTRSKLT
jgi:hypothetical protein